MPTLYSGEVELKEIDENVERLEEAEFVSHDEQGNIFIAFSVAVTDRNLGFTIQEDVLGVDDGLFVGTVDRNGPQSSSQILEGDQIIKIGHEDVAHLSKATMMTLLRCMPRPSQVHFRRDLKHR